MTKALYVTFTVFILALLWSVTATSAPKELVDTPYADFDNPVKVVEQARIEAVEQDKLLMLVFGADWCHDSRGLAARLSEPEMQTLLDEYYVPVFMSVGYLKNLSELMGQFGHPVYFGTPTVLIIEPDSKQLLNRDSLVMWQSADSQPPEATLEYFTQFIDADARIPPFANTPDEVLAKIRSFEAQQAARLYDLYAILGPELEKDVNGEAEDNFIQFWRDVYRFRTQLQEDLNSLYLRAQQPSETEALLMEAFVAPDTISWEQ